MAVERGEPCDGRFAALQALVERSQTEKKDPEETGS
jgi:hypothetical protein